MNFDMARADSAHAPMHTHTVSSHVACVFCAHAWWDTVCRALRLSRLKRWNSCVWPCRPHLLKDMAKPKPQPVSPAPV